MPNAAARLGARGVRWSQLCDSEISRSSTILDLEIQKFQSNNSANTTNATPLLVYSVLCRRVCILELCSVTIPYLRTYRYCTAWRFTCYCTVSRIRAEGDLHMHRHALHTVVQEYMDLSGALIDPAILKIRRTFPETRRELFPFFSLSFLLSFFP